MDQVTSRRRRRTYSAEFKSEAVAACRRPGVSIAATALDRSMNANVLRRWVVEAERSQGATVVPTKPALAAPDKSFIPVALPDKAGGAAPIRIEVRRGSLTVSVQWPSAAMHECASWLREVLK